MSRILLADDSPHAQRMGERILREEGFEVVSLTDGGAVMARLSDVDPDVIVADVFLPGKSGFELCRYVKTEPRFKHVRVVLTAGLLEPFDEDEAKRAGCDAIIKKPFEAARVVATIDPLVKDAQHAREPLTKDAQHAREPLTKDAQHARGATVAEIVSHPPVSAPPPTAETEPVMPVTPVELPKAAAPPEPVSGPAAPPQIDAERVRAAVTLALDAALPALIQEITERVLIALGH